MWLAVPSLSATPGHGLRAGCTDWHDVPSLRVHACMHACLPGLNMIPAEPCPVQPPR